VSIPSKSSQGTAAFTRAGEWENGEPNGVSHTGWEPFRTRVLAQQLDLSPTQTAALAETRRQFTAVFNAVCAHGWRERLSNGVKLDHATYYPLKADYPDLVSDLHVQARQGNRGPEERIGA